MRAAPILAMLSGVPGAVVTSSGVTLKTETCL